MGMCAADGAGETRRGEAGKTMRASVPVVGADPRALFQCLVKAYRVISRREYQIKKTDGNRRLLLASPALLLGDGGLDSPLL